MKKHYLLQCEFKTLVEKHNANMDIENLNNLELKTLANWHARDRDDAIPATNYELKCRIQNTRHRGDMDLKTYLVDVGVDENKLNDMSVHLNEQEFFEMIDQEMKDKEIEEASKTFTTVLTKYQRDKDKHVMLKNNLKILSNRLFEGNILSIDDTKLKLLKDLKLYVVMKTIKNDEPVPSTITLLRERCNSTRERPFIDLKTYLICRGCERVDVQNYLCS